MSDEHKIIAHYVLRPVRSFEEKVLLVAGVMLAYIDIATDVSAAVVYYYAPGNIYFSLTIAFIAVPSVISVSLHDNWTDWILALLHLQIIKEAYISYSCQQETPLMSTLRLLESIVEACPSALLQFYVLMRQWFNSTERNTRIVESTSDGIILFSVCMSLLSVSWTLAYALRSRAQVAIEQQAEERADFRVIVLCRVAAFTYHVFEALFRLTSIVAVFLAFGLSAIGFVLLALLCRIGIALHFGLHRDVITDWSDLAQLTKSFGRFIFALVTDSVWAYEPRHVKMTSALQVLTTLEGGLYFLCLFTAAESRGEDQYKRRSHTLVVVSFCCLLGKVGALLARHRLIKGLEATLLVAEGVKKGSPIDSLSETPATRSPVDITMEL